MAPTRELVSQIWGEGRKMCWGGGVKCGCVYGGAPAREQLIVSFYLFFVSIFLRTYYLQHGLSLIY